MNLAFLYHELRLVGYVDWQTEPVLSENSIVLQGNHLPHVLIHRRHENGGVDRIFGHYGQMGFEPVTSLDQNGSTTIRKELVGGGGGPKVLRP